jgi:hypothetical protein
VSLHKPEMNNNFNKVNKRRDVFMDNYHQTWAFKSLQYEKTIPLQAWTGP